MARGWRDGESCTVKQLQEHEAGVVGWLSLFQLPHSYRTIPQYS